MVSVALPPDRVVLIAVLTMRIGRRASRTAQRLSFGGERIQQCLHFRMRRSLTRNWPVFGAVGCFIEHKDSIVFRNGDLECNY